MANFNTNFKLMIQVLGNEFWKNESLKLICEGFMPLSYDTLYKNEVGIVVGIMHTYVQNGDLMRDPDMEIQIKFREHGEHEAYPLYFRNDGVGVFRRTTLEDGTIRWSEMEDQSEFLEMWLKNLIAQGHKVEHEVEVAS
jgi:hypothetical protein